MNEALLTAIATVLLVIVGLAQIVVLIAQKRQTRIALTAQYRQLWINCKKHWGNIIFIAREKGEYYQVLDETAINKLIEKTKLHRLDTPTTWALDSIQNLSGLLGEVSTRVLQGHLKISDVYPIFGTEFLRHSRPLRQLLEPEYKNPFFKEDLEGLHKLIKNEIQDWLIYHDGLRRRCLILIDLLGEKSVNSRYPWTNKSIFLVIMRHITYGVCHITQSGRGQRLTVSTDNLIYF